MAAFSPHRVTLVSSSAQMGEICLYSQSLWQRDTICLCLLWMWFNVTAKARFVLVWPWESLSLSSSSSARCRCRSKKPVTEKLSWRESKKDSGCSKCRKCFCSTGAGILVLQHSISIITEVQTYCQDSPYHCITEKVTEIKTNIFVTSFGPVSDTEMVRELVSWDNMMPSDSFCLHPVLHYM